MKSAIRNAIATLEKRSVRRYKFLVWSQVALSLLDIAGVAVIGALSIRCINSSEPGTRVQVVLDTLYIDNLSFQTQTAILGLLAATFLLTKTAFSMWLTRKTLKYLSIRTYQLSSKLSQEIFLGSREVLNTRSSQQFLYNVTAGANSAVLGVLGNFMTLIADSALLILMFVTILVVDPIMAAIGIVLGILVVKFGYLRMHKIASKLGHEHATLNVSGNQLFLNTFTSFREYFVRNQIKTQVQEFHSTQLRLAHVNADLAFLPSISKYVVEGTLILSALMISASQFILKDASHAAASLSVFLAASTRVAPAAMRVQQSLIQLQSSAAISRGAFEMASELEGMKDQKKQSQDFISKTEFFKPEIVIKNLGFGYSTGHRQIFESLNLTVKAGESLGVVGSSGSGKSTLADLMLGVLDPSSGSISISGVAPRSAIEQWPGEIAYVPQDVHLIEGTFRENIQFGVVRNGGDEQILEVVRICQLGNLISKSDDLNLEVGENGSRLSGGQRQRLGIARALYTNPKLLILDEISSALDAETESSIIKVLEALRREVTVILIAHRLSTIKNCDRIVYLNKGQLVGLGNFEELRKQVPEFDNQARLMGL